MESNREIVIIGFGGHAKSITDSIERSGNYTILGYTDTHDCHVGYKYLGTDDILKDIFNRGIHSAAIGLGFLGEGHLRERLIRQAINIGFDFPAIVDPSAVVSRGTRIGRGSFVGKNAVVNTDTQIGDFCIINTGAVLEHENVINNFSHIAVRATLCGKVEVGQYSFVGAGATIIQGKRIGSNCIVGAGSTVLEDVLDNTKVYGLHKTKQICDEGGNL